MFTFECQTSDETQDLCLPGTNFSYSHREVLALEVWAQEVPKLWCGVMSCLPILNISLTALSSSMVIIGLPVLYDFPAVS